MRAKICIIRGEFKNLYEWGSGWSHETAEKWALYWNTVKMPIGWKFVAPERTWDCGNLMQDTHGSIYLHPMDFTTVFRAPGGCCPRGNDDELEDYFGRELDELKKLCDGAAKACGEDVSFSLLAKVADVEYSQSDMRLWEAPKE